MAQTSLPPGFRFHPTDVELVSYYLKRKIMGKKLIVDAISEVELYKFPPWDLPDKSCLRSRDLEWFFFCPRDKKYPNGSRTNRTTPNGYWKTSGKDRTIMLNSRIVGLKKTLIFHEGKAPKGDRTDWVMYEYKMEDDSLVSAGFSKDAYVLCKIFKKSGLGPRIGEQYGAPFNENEWENAEAETSMFHLMPASEVVNPVEDPHIEEAAPAGPASVLVNPVEDAHIEDAAPAGTMEQPILQDSSAAANTCVEDMAFVDAVAGSDVQDGVVSENNISDEVHNLCDPPEFDGFSLEDLSNFLDDSPLPDNALGDNVVLPPMSEAEAYAFEMNTIDLYNELSGIAGFGDVPNSLHTGTDGIMERNHTVLPADRELSTDEFLELNDLLAPDASFPNEFPAQSSQYFHNHNDVPALQASFESGVMHQTMPSIFEVCPPDYIGIAPQQAAYLSDPSMQYPFP